MDRAHLHSRPRQPQITPADERLLQGIAFLRTRVWSDSSSTKQPYVCAAAFTLHYTLFPSYSFIFLVPHTSRKLEIFSLELLTVFTQGSSKFTASGSLSSHTAGLVGITNENPDSSRTVMATAITQVGTAPSHLSGSVTITCHAHTSNCQFSDIFGTAPNCSPVTKHRRCRISEQ